MKTVSLERATGNSSDFDRYMGVHSDYIEEADSMDELLGRYELDSSNFCVVGIPTDNPVERMEVVAEASETNSYGGEEHAGVPPQYVRDLSMIDYALDGLDRNLARGMGYTTEIFTSDLSSSMEAIGDALDALEENFPVFSWTELDLKDERYNAWVYDSGSVEVESRELNLEDKYNAEVFISSMAGLYRITGRKEAAVISDLFARSRRDKEMERDLVEVITDNTSINNVKSLERDVGLG